MANQGELLLRLEKRIIALEKALNIRPDVADLIHPRSEKAVEEQLSRNLEYRIIDMVNGLHAYIYDRYDMATQATFICLYVDPAIPVEIKSHIIAAWNWIKQVLAYYFQVREQIITNKEWQEPDYHQFDKSFPQVRLGDLMKEIIQY